MDLPVAIALAVVGGLITLVLCDLAGGIARAKGRSYWLFFAFGLLLWFPSLITALALPARTDAAAGPDAARSERALSTVLLAQIAEADLADLRALDARNDVELP